MTLEVVDGMSKQLVEQEPMFLRGVETNPKPIAERMAASGYVR
jgi:hypothetical protein